MKDPRLVRLAEIIVSHSLNVQPGERVYINFQGIATKDLTAELIQLITKKGAIPFWYFNDPPLFRDFLKEVNPEQMRSFTDLHRAIMKDVDCYIGINGTDNVFEHSDLSPEKLMLLQNVYKKEVVFEERVPNTRWCVLRYPNGAMAQLAQHSVEEFEEFFFRVCTLDYKELSKNLDPLKDLMDRTDRVRIEAPGTDLQFSIKGIPTVICAGKMNLPDGEIYTAPVRDSVNGTIRFNTPSLYKGEVFEVVELEFSEGRIIECDCNGNKRKLKEILNSDGGSSYTGEFALGVNPHILEPMKDTLFDEKIYGSFHLTPGNSYDDADNGNKSAVHWDLIQIQRPEYGGGRILFDDVLIREDGEFVLSQLLPLNKRDRGDLF
ncbi:MULTISPECIES: aminopeptidase [unclassified Oceanispirochaeta]|uniref:aminopeptidase n=1 Tax=unclassified Oceanispirochaeta TaxID=2635722 RepID=UPI000E096DA5|nr:MULTISPECIES: aminopeptidase [unclassified Oceanispirochaeta]MBF9017611.1 aminopeptidase [Oceanispirochaeta sp. M2]NPD74183.1 aminopeptidase [Oceanispirochaeta sp. M1]RDG29996.1 aminopeptidase [Oceanispirochaeta sp. M1]